jgi:uncharacterized membrane protein
MVKFEHPFFGKPLKFLALNNSVLSKIYSRIAPCLLIICLAFALVQATKFYVPLIEKRTIGFKGEKTYYKYKYRARVLEVEGDLSDPLHQDQIITISITNGAFKEIKASFKNNLTGNPYLDTYLNKGDRIFCEVKVIKGKISSVKFIDFIRTDYLLYGISIFFFFIALICGKRSFGIILSLLISSCLLYLLVAVIKQGFDPIAVTIIISFFLAVIAFKLIARQNIKVFSSASGTVLSLTIVSVSTYLIVSIMKYTGVDIEMGRIRVGLTLWQVYGSALNYQKIIVAGIIFGALGAVMDISMVVASAVNELKIKYKNLSFSMAIKSGFAIGRDVIGTTANTLLFAYVAQDITLLVLIFLQTEALNDNQVFLKFFNFEEISIESVRIIMGSIGLLLAVPLTALIVSYAIRFYKYPGSAMEK